MKLSKYSIKIEREALRCNSKNKITSSAFPKAFGNKEKNNFITADEDESVLVIKTPMSESIVDGYGKFVEITNVVIEELYKLDEYIWPVSDYKTDKEEVNTYAKIKLSIDEDFFNELKGQVEGLPENLEESYKLIKENFINKQEMIENLYGECKCKVSKSSVSLYNIRLNHKDKNGISISDVEFLVGFLFGCLLNEETKNLKEEIKRLIKFNNKYSLKVREGLENIYEEIKEKETRTSVEAKLSKEDILVLADKYKEEGHYARYCLQDYEKLVAESVCLIKDAISLGIDYEVLNETKSVVRFISGSKEEFVIEGNKTDRDSYIFPIITDDKFTSKEIMNEAGVNVPEAILLESDMDEEDKETLLKPFYNQKLVVKPRNTNYGTGITVFSKPATKTQILNAVEYAFQFDNNVLIEEYVKGMEYRFLVIDGKCLSVAHRRIASVVGDGKSTIEELIDEKNKEPWHFLTGTPVKKDAPVVEYLKLQGLDFKSVLKKDKRVFLRTNSNCSTGGESIDYTDIMPAKFKKIAEKAAKAFDAKICGVDIIIDDLEKDDYSIIEINDNPGYSINEWPYEGRGEKIGISVLRLLDLLPEGTKIKI